MRRNTTALIVVAIVGLVPILILSVANSFVPTWRDLKDPLGRPSQLTADIVDSAHQFDLITARLIPKHDRLAGRITALRELSDDLAGLTADVSRLPGDTAALTTTIGSVDENSRPIPALVSMINARVAQVNAPVTELAGDLTELTTMLQSMNSTMADVGQTVDALGPRSKSIADSLASIEEEASRVRVLGPVLGAIGPWFNSFGIGPLPLQAPPLPGPLMPERPEGSDK